MQPVPLPTEDAETLRDLFRGNQEAVEFIFAWKHYVHLIDDLIDGEIDGRQVGECVCELQARACYLFTIPFFLRHMSALRAQVILCTNAYADSVRWEKSSVPWQRNLADMLRHSGADMVRLVASICAGDNPDGYRHLRRISADIHSVNYHEHRTPDGQPD